MGLPTVYSVAFLASVASAPNFLEHVSLGAKAKWINIFTDSKVKVIINRGGTQFLILFLKLEVNRTGSRVI